jgi:hypothetical protein
MLVPHSDRVACAFTGPARGPHVILPRAGKSYALASPSQTHILHCEDAKGAKNKTDINNLRVLRSFAVNSWTDVSYALFDAVGGSPYNEEHDCRWGDRFLPCICF